MCRLKPETDQRQFETSSTEDGPELSRGYAIVVVLLSLLALGIRLYRLGHFSYWLDEILGTYFIQGNWTHFWAALRFDAVHPPLDYLVARGVEHFRPSDPVRKLPDVLWGTLSVASLGLLLRRRCGRVAGALTMLLLALSPFHVRYSQEFRPYSLGTLLVCVALLCLDGFLERSSPRRLAIVFAAFLAALYTLYLGGIVAILAGIAMVGGDSISIDPDRRRTARRALTLSPLFVAGLLIAYLPWLRVMLEAARRTPPSLPPPVTLARYVSLAAFFGTWSFDGGPFTVGVAVFAALVVIGAVAALRDSRLLFFVAWALLGMGVIELVEHFRPHFYSPRHYLPAGIGLVCLAGIGLATLLERSHLTACAGLIALGTLVAFESKGLQAYFVAGRPDWRPVSSFLQKQNAGERIFTENQHTQLCIGFYVLGPHWMLPGNRAAKREIISLDGNPIPLGWAWLPDRNAWLVLAAGPPSERLRQWSARYPSLRFRTGEGDGWATVVHLVR